MHIPSSNIYFDIKIGDSLLGVEKENFLEVEIVETAGLELPTIELGFMTYSEKVKNQLLENNVIQVYLGTSPQESESYDVHILAKDAGSTGYGYSCVVVGFLLNKKVLTGKAQYAIKGTSFEGIGQVCDKFEIEFLSDLSESKDTEQVWSIYNESYRNLLYEMWLHMDLRPSFPLIAITREGSLLLRDYDTMLKQGSVKNFTQVGANTEFDIPFSNSFEIVDHTYIYNIYNGYGKLTNIHNTEEGTFSSLVGVSENTLATSQALEVSRSGNKVLEGYRSSENVHSTYYDSYFYNASKLIQLSSIYGEIKLIGIYKDDLNLLDLVNVVLADSNDPDNGKYIVDTLVYSMVHGEPFTTTVYVTRDSKNNLENNIINADTGISIPSSKRSSLLNFVSNARTLLTYIRKGIDGTLATEVKGYFITLKNNVLNNFSIDGQIISLTSQVEALASLKNLGRTKLYQLLDLYVPQNVQYFFENVGWSNDLSILNILKNAVYSFAPTEIADFYEEVIILIDKINLELNDIEEDVKEKEGVNISMLELTTSQSSERVNKIVTEVLGNTGELNIPIPVISLTESHALLTDVSLKDVIVDNIIAELDRQGYLTGISNAVFKQILLGEIVLDSITINTIENNINSILYTRYWGVWEDSNDISEYNIRRSFQEPFSTVGCIKYIEAKGGKYLYFVAPSIETGLTFYVNDVLTTFQSTDLNLLVFDDRSKRIPFKLYYGTEQYNSSSVKLEVRKS